MSGSRSRKAPKDKHAPKKNLTSYLIFSNVRRPILREENKDKKITEIAKMIAAEWKGLSSEEKKKYEDKAALDKTRYEKEFALYKETDSFKNHQKKLAEHKAEQKDTIKKKKSNKGKPKKPKNPESMPKKSVTGYFIYLNERRSGISKENPDAKNVDITKIAGAEWQKLDETKKGVYNEKAKLLKLKYEEDIKKYKETNEYKEFMQKMNDYKIALKKWKKLGDDNVKESPKNGKLKKIKLPKKPIDSNAPKKPVSAYLMYSNERRKYYQDKAKANGEKFKLKDATSLISADWKNLSDDNKKIYQDKYLKNCEEYKKLMNEYKNSNGYKEFEKKINEWKKQCDNLKKVQISKPVAKKQKVVESSTVSSSDDESSSEDSDDETSESEDSDVSE